jgi:hypothetical protein
VPKYILFILFDYIVVVLLINLTCRIHFFGSFIRVGR